MTWTTMQQKARDLGFDVACQMGAVDVGGHPGAAAPPQGDASWTCVGTYHGVGLWARPLTEQARAMSSQRVAAVISSCCRYVGTPGDHDEEFHSFFDPLLAAAANPEHGRMPA